MSGPITRILTSLACGSVALLGLGAPAQAASNGRIAYLSDFGMGSVSVVDPTAGATPKQVGPAPVGRPAFSPDGGRIAVIDATGTVETFLPDGSGLSTVATGASTDHVTPAWSPDATRIAYFKGSFPDYTLVIHGTASGASEQVVTPVGEFPQGALAWSPNGATLLYSTFSGIWSVPAAAGATPSKVNIPGEAGLENTGASWSPDGSRFAFTRMCTGCSDPALSGLWTAGADGSDPQQLVSAGITTPASWSPDGSKIAYAAANNPGEIRVANSTGSGQSGTLIVAADFASSPSWGATPAAPRMVTAPKITGGIGYGQKLTTDRGAWLGAPTGYTVQWQRCSAGNCVGIAGATGSTHVIVQEDLGKALRVRVTATNALGSATGESTSTSIPALPKGGAFAKSAVPKVLKVSGGKVKVPLMAVGKTPIVSANVKIAKAKKVIGTKAVRFGKPKAKAVTTVKLNKAGLQALKKTPSLKGKFTISLVTKKGSKFYSIQTTFTRTVQK